MQSQDTTTDISKEILIFPSSKVFKRIDCDIELKEQVVQSIRNREKFVDSLRCFLSDKDLPKSHSRFSRILFSLHSSALSVTDTIVAWSKKFPRSTPILHNGDVIFNDKQHSQGKNYMLNMLTDLSFADNFLLSKKLIKKGESLWRNPFVLKMNVDEIIKYIPGSSFPTTYNLQIGHTNNSKFHSSWNIDTHRVKEASYQILHVEQTVFGQQKHPKICQIMTDRNTRPISFYHVPLPLLNNQELYQYINMEDPPLAAALVVSCARLILGCNDTVLQKIHFFSRELAYELLQQPLSLMLNKMYALEEQKQTISIHVVRLIHPVIMHEHLSPKILENELCHSIANLAEWIRSVVNSFMEEYEQNEEFVNLSLDNRCSVDTPSTKEARMNIMTDERLEPMEEEPEQTSDREEIPEEEVSTKIKRKKKKTKKLTKGPYPKIKMESLGNKCNQKKEEDDCDEYDLSLNKNAIPISCLVQVIEGSKMVRVLEGSSQELSNGDIIRIDHVHFSPNWKVTEINNSDGKGEYWIISRPYDHTSILNKISFQNNDPLLRLYDPYSKKVNTTDGCLKKNNVSDQNKHIFDVLGNRADCEKKLSLGVEKRDRFTLKYVQVWRFIEKSDDDRPKWKIMYDNKDIPWQSMYSNSEEYFERFNVKVNLAQIEEQCKDSSDPRNTSNQQRLHHFVHVPLQLILSETFNTVCKWHPAGNHIDNVKWAKLARKMNFLSIVKNPNHEADMVFLRHCRDRKLNLTGFENVLKEIIGMKSTHEIREVSCIVIVVWLQSSKIPLDFTDHIFLLPLFF